ncbi:hypothetical protein HPB50_025718 [Hyalomma asiaticum]|uniref:Uncharacterized protein n=1 Tax=Hyalomma asiaticum TaxID=266040 RepID=A0ACB7RQ97_HYAAI|nr:hypothetical protein HPB50_025718 [Hyalomma asiaticum]
MKVLFKMDRAGFGNLYERSRLGECFGQLADRFTHEKFRQMCILSGCDYLPSLPGIGLGKASKFFKLITNPNIRATLPKLPSYLKMPALCVDDEYVENFLRAENTFRHQLVFCPIRNDLVPLNPYDPSVDPTDMTYAGQQLPREQAFDIAVGNIDVNTGQKIDNYYPKDGKILRERDTQDQKVTPKNDGDVKDSTPRRLGAFEVSERRLVRPTTPRTPVRQPQRPPKPLSSVENIDAEYDKQESPWQHLEGNSLGSSGTPVGSSTIEASPIDQNEVGNVFKATPKRVVRSRFFSSPATPSSPNKKLTECQIQLSKSVSDGGEDVPSKLPHSSASQGKFQWGSKLAPHCAPATPVSMQASTPFKRLRLSVSALEGSKKASCVLGTIVKEHGKSVQALEADDTISQDSSFSQPEISKFPANSFSEPPESNSGSPVKNIDSSRPMHRHKSLFEVLEENHRSAQMTTAVSPPPKFRNPFAKPAISPTTDLTVLESDEEDPIPLGIRKLSKQHDASSLTKFQRVTSVMDHDLEECEESPIPKFESSCGSSEAQGNSSQDLDYPNSLEDESPWPSRRTVKQDPVEKEVVEESDDDDLMVTGAVIVKRPLETPKHLIGKPRIPSKPTKKEPSKQRRLGLSKSCVKKDTKQQSLLESLTKFHFKKSCL